MQLRAFLGLTGIIDVSLIGAVLSQCDDSGVDYPVAYLPHEEHYSTAEKERLKIRLGVHAFCFYLLG